MHHETSESENQEIIKSREIKGSYPGNLNKDGRNDTIPRAAALENKGDIRATSEQQKRPSIQIMGLPERTK